ncbi:phage tail tape measure protein [Gordonia sp. SL306]|uniref:phage tail tape measure protein n=1 Tax=Gordonia sp. SL306 TaxID=2995145 RepID=UPI002271FBAD|nr:phage tail tape measure protein [Gordonia sp. SL306]WAC54268.1 phage tail tape measure protein [Gordonia sp. SL306]
MPLDVGKLRATIELDIKGFQSDTDKAKTQFKQLGRDAEDAGRRSGKAFDGVGTSATQEAQRAQTGMSSSFGKAESDAKKAGDGISGAFAGAFRKVGADSKTALSDSFSGMGQAAGEAGKESGAGFVSGFAPRIASIGGKGGPIGIALAGTAALGLAAGAALADQVNKGFDQQQEKGKTKATFGWTPEQAQQAGKAAAGAYTNVFGDSVNENMKSVGVAMQSGLLDGNATAAQIQPVIEKLSTVSTIMGTEIPETARAAGQMVKTGLADNAGEALDLLTAAQHKGLNLSGDLLDTMNEYGTQFRKVGLDGADALGLINQAWQNGARDTDVAADAIKEFTLRATDGSESTATALQGLGLNVEQITGELAKGGEPAKQGLDKILDSLREMPPSVEKNKIAAALFGTQWEDLGGAFDKFDLSKARNELGQTGGATDKAAQDMSNGATSIEEVKRRISVAADDMRAKLADAFGPAAGDFANWVESHGTEIENFFINTAKYSAEFGAVVLQTTGYLLGFGSRMLWVGSMIADGLLMPIGASMKAIGELTSYIPGMGGVGDALKSAGDKVMGVGDGIRATAKQTSQLAEMFGGAAEKANHLADTIKTIPPNTDIRVDAPGGNDVLNLLKQMGVEATTNNDKTISTSIPEGDPVLQKLQAIGIEVVNRNGKQVLVTADDKAYQNAKKFGKWTETEYKDVIVRGYQSGQNPFAPGNSSGIIAGPPSAGGGQVFGPGGPKDDLILTPLSNREFVHQVAAVDYYGVGFMKAVNEGRFPRMFAHGFADGGQVTTPGLTSTDQQSMWDSVHTKFPDAQMSSGTRTEMTEGHPDYHNAGKAIDIAGSNMGGIASWIAQTYPDSLELIHSPFGHNIKDGKDVGDGMSFYGAATMAEHADHVHWALGHTAVKQAAAPGGYDPSKLTSKQRNIDEIVAEGQKRGKSEKEIRSAVMAALAESDGEDLDYGDRDSVGAFQQRPSQGWGDPKELQDTTIAAGKYYDALDKVQGKDTMSEAQMAQAVQRSAFSDGSNYQAKADEADKELAASLGRLSAVKTAAPDSATAAGGVQQVFVTNWPSGITTTTPTTDTTPKTTTPKAAEPDAEAMKLSTKYLPGGLEITTTDPTSQKIVPPDMRRFAFGGTIPGVGNTDSVPLMGMPGEEIIRKQIAEQPGMRQYLKAINAGQVQPQMFASGGTVGFGGYTDDQSDTMAPNNWYDYLALGVGGGFSALSVVEPYIGMAVDRKVDLSNITPQIDTGNNTSAVLAGAVGEIGGQLIPLVEKLVKLTAEGKTIVVKDGRDPFNEARMASLRHSW